MGRLFRLAGWAVGRSPHGERGLKFQIHVGSCAVPMSLPPRGAWIEILYIALVSSTVFWSLPPTGSVDRNSPPLDFRRNIISSPPWGAWIKKRTGRLKTEKSFQNGSSFCRSFCRRPGCRHRNSCCPNCPVLCGGLRRTVSPQMLVKSLDKLCDVQDFIARSGYK